MNRKRTRKLIRKVEQAKKLHFLNYLDDPLAWLQGNVPCPWSDEQVREYQIKLDSAFGAKNAIVLAWSYDRRFWDEFYEDWHATGLPKGRLAKKPILLFKEVAVNDGKDHLYVSTPRFLLLERLHGSELEASWEASSWVGDPTMLGGQKRIRSEKPPENFYQIFRTIAEHETPVMFGDYPPCCRRLWDAGKSICYGKYRPPSDADLSIVRSVRERQDALGVVQRNDAPRLAKVMEHAAASTRHFIKQAERRRASAVKELILGDPQGYMVDIFKNYKIDLSAREIDATLREGLERAEEERFEKTL